jgi:Na+/H+ antiporter NhaD/arsenite permease-like protein
VPNHPSPWAIIPFGAVLLAIAIGPTLFHSWWNKHYPKLTLSLAALTVGYYLFLLPHGTDAIFHTAHDYFGFIALIGSLYVVAGGIHIHVGHDSSPSGNVLFLFIGAVVSNLLGTTGASMLLIRPWLRLNQNRAAAHHVVFFIFIVSNVGGCLTPIGDPPLFLGFLKGVPFWWVAAKCWPMWLLGVGVLLAVFYVLDVKNLRRCADTVKQSAAKKLPHESSAWRLDGLANVACLVIILGAVFVSQPLFLREFLMIGAATVSWLTTNKRVHEANHFSWHPVIEVIVLFAAIFLTMMPALDWLRANGHDVFGQQKVGTMYWASGILSSVLDNAPTYLACFTAVAGDAYSANTNVDPYLVAISIGAVFFGANTYIGNGPNFMVRSIAAHRKVPTPTFFGYVTKWTLPVMIPMLVILWLIFFR